MRAATWVVGISLLALMTTGCAGFFEHQVDNYRFARALVLQRQGERAKALEIYRTLDPYKRRYPGVLNNIGVIYAQQGRLDMAEQRLSEASRVEHDEAVIWTNLGIVRFLMERHMAARRALEEVASAAGRRLAKVAGRGRANFDYPPMQRRVDRSISKAESYLKLLARKVAVQRRSNHKPGWIPGALSLLRVRTTM